MREKKVFYLCIDVNETQLLGSVKSTLLSRYGEDCEVIVPKSLGTVPEEVKELKSELLFGYDDFLIKRAHHFIISLKNKDKLGTYWILGNIVGCFNGITNDANEAVEWMSKSVITFISSDYPGQSIEVPKLLIEGDSYASEIVIPEMESKEEADKYILDLVFTMGYSTGVGNRSISVSGNTKVIPGILKSRLIIKKNQ